MFAMLSVIGNSKFNFKNPHIDTIIENSKFLLNSNENFINSKINRYLKGWDKILKSKFDENE
jgi:hypothetical protein